MGRNLCFVIKQVHQNDDDNFLDVKDHSFAILYWNSHTKEMKTVAQNILLYDFSNDGKDLLIVDLNQNIKLLNAETGIEKKRFEGINSEITSVAFDAKSSNLAIASDNKVAIWDNQKANAPIFIDVKSKTETNSPISVQRMTFSPDGDQLALGGNRHLSLWEPQNGMYLYELNSMDSSIHSAKFSADGDYLFVRTKHNDSQLFERLPEYDIWNPIIPFSQKELSTVQMSPLKEMFQYNFKLDKLWEEYHRNQSLVAEYFLKRNFPYGFDSVSTPDGRFVLTGEILWSAKEFIVNDKQDGVSENSSLDAWQCELEEILDGHHVDGEEFVLVETIEFSADGRWIISGGLDGVAQIFDPITKQKHQFLGHHAPVTAVSMSSDNQWLLTGSKDSSARLWDSKTGEEAGRLYIFTDGTWLVVDKENRFDTNNLEDLRGVSWVMPDEPFKPLPVEIFMKNFYEPQLLSKILSQAPLQDVPDLSKLNRLIPVVQIVGVRQVNNNDKPSAKIYLKITNIQDGSNRSGAQDLHLFRDGQLVKYIETIFDQEDETESQSGLFETIIEVQLPCNGRKTIEFSAYAFNSDGVKSLTARNRLELERPLPIEKGTVYLIPIGVNSYADDQLNLNYAANDAQAMSVVLSGLMQKQSQTYGDVVTIPLISDDLNESASLQNSFEWFQKVIKNLGITLSPKRNAPLPATKENFLTVLDVLAGREPKNEELAKKLKDEKVGLAQARPEDLVLFSFSGHGQSGEDEDDLGAFYFLMSGVGGPIPSDVEEELGFKKARLGQMLSSIELTEAIRDVDAGDMAFIIDACHSASVQEQEFKPGPMGSRGLAQLAYNKGMLILAASQADDVALENQSLKHGLMTYALIDDGLLEKMADFGRSGIQQADQKIELTEWLSFAVDQVPRIHESIKQKKGSARLVQRGQVIDWADEGKTLEMLTKSLQQPTLFKLFGVKRILWLYGSQGINEQNEQSRKVGAHNWAWF